MPVAVTNPWAAQQPGQSPGFIQSVIGAANTGQTWIQQAASLSRPPAIPQTPNNLNRPVSPLANQLIQQGVPTSAANQIGSFAPTYSASQGHPDPGLLQRIANNPEEFNALNPAQQDAVTRLLEQSAGGGGGGQAPTNKGDFYGYEFNPDTGRSERVVKNAATGGDFLKELRWDPQKKKYVQIGTLIKQGKLDLQGRTHKGRRQRQIENAAHRQATSAPAAPQVQQTTEGFIGGFGVVNFNTSSG